MHLPTEAKLYSTRPIIGNLIVLYKKLLRFFTRPYFRHVFEYQQNFLLERFRGDITAALERTDALFVTLDQRMETLRIRYEKGIEILKARHEELLQQHYEDLEQRLRDTMQEMELQKQHYEDLEQRLRDTMQEMELQKRSLELIFSKLKRKSELDVGAYVAISKHHFMDHAYFLFEQEFRGDTEDIKRRQSIYIPIVKELWREADCGDSWILDIGCGRGEFLELMQEEGIPAKGVDLNENMVAYCQEKGLEVERAEAISYLSNIEDSSLCAIISCQFIEHLTISSIIDFVKLCYMKIKTKGKLIIETLNPESVYGMTKFYLDISHEKPLHPQTMIVLLHNIGFYDIELKYLSPVPEHLKLQANGDRNIEKLNNLLFADREYVVVATR